MNRIILYLLFSFQLLGDWKDTQVFYWFNNANPGVALTSAVIHQIDHAVGGVTGVQIGNSSGVQESLCTGFITAGTCPSMRNCEWCRDHKNVFNDTLQFVDGRPLTLGITYIATNLILSQNIVWFSTVTKTWITGVITLAPVGEHKENFGVPGESGWAGVLVISSTPQAGDSGSPVFTSDGDFIGSIVGTASPAGAVVNFLYPQGSTYRNSPPPPVPSAYSIGTIYTDEE